MMVKATTENSKKLGPYPDDLALGQAAGSGDRMARQIVAERLYNRVRATVRYITGDHRDQDDWVQQSLVEILRSLSSFRGDSSLETWANKIAVRKTLRLLKKQKKRDATIGLNLEPWFNEPQESMNFEQRFFLKKHLARAFGGLSIKYRTVLTLRIVQGCSVEEIATMVDAPINTVRQRLRRGRKMLVGKVAKDPVLKDWIGSRKS